MKIATITETTELEKLLPLLSNIEQYYPDILCWYKEKFLHFPSLSNKALIAYNDNDEIIGFCLGKKSESETKLRCIYVIPDYRGKGTGIRLIDEMLIELDDKYPVATVSEELLHMYSYLFISKYKWKIIDIQKGLYRIGKLEYFFNGYYKE